MLLVQPLYLWLFMLWLPCDTRRGDLPGRWPGWIGYTRLRKKISPKEPDIVGSAATAAMVEQPHTSAAFVVLPPQRSAACFAIHRGSARSPVRRRLHSRRHRSVVGQKRSSREDRAFFAITLPELLVKGAAMQQQSARPPSAQAAGAGGAKPSRRKSCEHPSCPKQPAFS